MKKFVLSLVCLLIAFVSAKAQSGKNGDVTITSSGAMVNAYTTLTADAAAGSMRIKVANNTLSNNFSGPLEDGDLIFIYQAQGATLNGWLDGNNVGMPGDVTWGEITDYNSSGNYEFVEVRKSNSADSIGLSCPLQHDYTVAGKTQIVRVPRYNSLTVNAQASITCPAWNGSTGGLVVVEAKTQTTVNGSIDASAKGFRGGSLVGDNATLYWPGYASINNQEGAEKGEGIAGYQDDYTQFGGKYARGAAANGGGGGNAHNGGGGGGANAGDTENWGGFGVPNTAYNAAWALESPSIAGMTSSGGGQGGYTFSGNNCDALAQGPHDACWGGDSRRPYGGKGGRPLDYSTGKLFFGGGGGAGDQNNNDGGEGGQGGGLVFIECYGPVLGSGSIDANGENGEDTDPSNPPINNYVGNDGAGGGGAGGTIVISTISAIGSDLTLNANGGKGGEQLFGRWTPFISIGEAEGPGGGGGGGYVSLSSAGPTVSVAGGVNGTTESPQLSEFPPNGATSGAAGISNTSFPAWYLYGINVTVLCGDDTATLTANTVGSLPGNTTITWHDALVGGNLLGTGPTYTAQNLTSSTVVYLGACPGHTRVPVEIQFASSVVTHIFPALVSCNGESVELFGQYYSTAGTYYDTLQSTQGCDSIISRDITESFVDTTVTEGVGVLSANQSNATYEWIDCASEQVISQQSVQVFEPPYDGSFAVAVSANGCKDTSNCHVFLVTNVNDDFARGITLYPSPVEDILKIDLGDLYKDVELSIYGVTGQVVYSTQVKGATKNIEANTNSFAPGVYLMQVRAGDKSAVMKFQKR